jgi:phosphatidylserine synthase
MGLVAVLSILMVSTIRYTSMKNSGSGRQGIFLVLAIAAMAMFIFFYSKYALLAIAATYVIHGVIWWIFRLIGRVVRPEAAA